MNKEIPLTGGRSTIGTVKIGNTVHKPISRNHKYIHNLLTFLEQKGYKYSPKFLGIDEKKREILSYIDGDILKGKTQWNEEQLKTVLHMMKELHDLTDGCELANKKEVVCHNDIAPWNTVFRNQKPIGFIDFNDSKPGYRIDDFAYFLWTYLNLGDDTPAKRQGLRIKMLLNEYKEIEREELIKAILKQQRKILRKRKRLSRKAILKSEREFSKEKIGIIKKEIAWIKKNRREIERIIKQN